MSDFSTVEDTLFVPMLGRIYATENFPNILCDNKALALKDKLPKNIKGQDTQTQYTLLAGAVRSCNMDRYIQKFMSENEDGVIVELGCGLETTFFRNNNNKNVWYGVDFEKVVNYRKNLLGTNEKQHLIVGDATSEDWLKTVREENPNSKILVTGSGLFYYFENEAVLKLFNLFKKYGNIEIVFDIVNSSGMKRISKYMKQVGHEDAQMFFYVDNAENLAKEVGAVCLNEEKYYKHTNKKGLKFSTKATMVLSDKFNMVKMVHLYFSEN